MGEDRASPILDADFEPVAEQRHNQRRRTERRTPRSRLTTLFAATLIAHIVEPDSRPRGRYTPKSSEPQRGAKLNLRA